MPLFCFCLLLLHFSLLLSFCKFPLAFLAFVKGKNVREDAAGDLLDLVLRDAGAVDEPFASTQDSPPSYAVG